MWNENTQNLLSLDFFLKAFKKGFVCNNSLKHSVFKYSMLTFQFGCYDCMRSTLHGSWLTKISIVKSHSSILSNFMESVFWLVWALHWRPLPISFWFCSDETRKQLSQMKKYRHSSGSLIRIRWLFHVRRLKKNGNDGFSWWTTCFSLYFLFFLAFQQCGT